ncbi:MULTISPECIES: hypothetical protein [Bacillus]|uniref:hypothetical protein n=1 Tax=Bacillus TaxID=1386 RepID=UPI00125F4D76|nr:hypothetical protein [Bacillus thuringiensis]KAB5659850.1 hypothetical protein E8M24_01850 [Bacillus thuringiensis]HDR5266637.1 hypothetical protein [Bacillus thuringiensis]
MKEGKWRTRDWGWVVGILIGFIVLILTIRLGDNQDVINLFSFISSSVSIALAGVAIFIALKQDSDNKQVNDRLVDLLNSIQIDVKSVDAKLDPSLLKSVGEETAQVYKDIEKKDTYTKSEVDEIINKVTKDVTLDINNILNQENNTENHKRVFRDNRVYNNASDVKNERERERARKKAIQIIRDNMEISLEEVREIIESETGYVYSLSAINRYRNKIMHGVVS